MNKLVALPDDMDRKVRVAAAAHKMSGTAFIRACVSAALAELAQRTPRFTLAPFELIDRDDSPRDLALNSPRVMPTGLTAGPELVPGKVATPNCSQHYRGRVPQGQSDKIDPGSLDIWELRRRDRQMCGGIVVPPGEAPKPTPGYRPVWELWTCDKSPSGAFTAPVIRFAYE